MLSCVSFPCKRSKRIKLGSKRLQPVVASNAPPRHFVLAPMQCACGQRLSHLISRLPPPPTGWQRKHSIRSSAKYLRPLLHCQSLSPCLLKALWRSNLLPPRLNPIFHCTWATWTKNWLKALASICSLLSPLRLPSWRHPLRQAVLQQSNQPHRPTSLTWRWISPSTARLRPPNRLKS